MPAGVTWSAYVKGFTACALAVAAGSQTVHLIYQPLKVWYFRKWYLAKYRLNKKKYIYIYIYSTYIEEKHFLGQVKSKSVMKIRCKILHCWYMYTPWYTGSWNTAKVGSKHLKSLIFIPQWFDLI